MSFLLGFVAPSFGQSPRTQRAESSLHITVRVYNSAQISPAQLADAEAQATILLQDTGVATVWLDCTMLAAGSPNDPACAQPFRSTDLALAVVDRLPSRVPVLRKTTLGFSLIPAVGFGHNAYVSADRAWQLAQDQEIPLELVLGYAVAHELGHLVLGLNAHWATGLMRAEWDTEDLRRATQGSLRFTAQQSAQIRAGALARQQGRRSLGCVVGKPDK